MKMVSEEWAGADSGPVLLYPTEGPNTCSLLLWNGSPSLRCSHPTRTYLSRADPWLWLLVRREKTLRSLRGRVGGEEGGVKPTSGGLSQEGSEGHVTWELLTGNCLAQQGLVQPVSFLTCLGHPASPCPCCPFPAPKLTWQAGHGHRISSWSEVKCPSHETAWD